jgi:hypothetical protein
MMLTAAERAEVVAAGRDPDEVMFQLAQLRAGPRFVRVDRPCTPGDGVDILSPALVARHLAAWAAAAAAGRLSSFVPASGAASRMVAALVKLRARAGADLSLEGARGLAQQDPSLEPAIRVIEGLGGLAVGRSVAGVPDSGELGPLLDALVGEDGVARGPKALLPFHLYPDGSVRTALHEHLVEAARCCVGDRGEMSFHMTMSEEHQEASAAEAQRVAAGKPWNVQMSEQHPSTDTVALQDGALARDADGAIRFRPGGHGSLLRNLERTGGDLVLVKNIDNVVPDRHRDHVVRWRRVLVGAMVALESRVHAALRSLEAGEASAAREVLTSLGRRVPDGADALHAALHRPLRVAGVVAQDGQPGGGPFFVSGWGPQIVELVQIDREDADQAKALAAATHFNPVDMVCALRDHRGEPFDLARFTDREAVIVSTKVEDGRDLTVVERPGLWNGGMAGWITVFVELPRAVFQPVKTLADLLGDGHLA